MKLLGCAGVGPWVAPRLSVLRRPATATLAKPFPGCAPALLEPRAMCPWPDMATLGIQYPKGLLPALSKRVPAWTRVGVVVRLVISYQRDPLRPPGQDGCGEQSTAAPLPSTWML